VADVALSAAPIPTSSPSGRAYRWVALVVASSYGLLVLMMWAPHTMFAGFPYETAFPYMSESGPSLLSGFLYSADPLRIHTNTFYHLGYLLGEAVGAGGSYVPYQVVHAALWWARGFLVFLLMRALFPQSMLASYVAGAFVLVHASDGALQWIGQMNQFGFIFWMLLACYLLSQAVDRRRGPSAIVFTLLACACSYMSLWSYESQILLILAFPIIPLVRRRPTVNMFAMFTAWYAVPLVYLALTLQKYTAGQATYQAGVVRHQFGLRSLISDLWFNVVSSVEFWSWGDASSAPRLHKFLAAAAVALVAATALAVRRSGGTARTDASTTRLRNWWPVLCTGILALVLSFPVYLLLDSSRSLWRTQFLSGIGAALLLTSVFSFIASAVPRRVQFVVFLALSSSTIWFGTVVALQRGVVHRNAWDAHRAVMQEILRVAPRVQRGALIVLANVPKQSDPFGHVIWLDLAVRLAYMGTPVSATYFYSDGTTAPGSNIKVVGDRWRWDGTGMVPEVRETPIENTVVVELDDKGHGGLSGALPTFVCQPGCRRDLYNPAHVISGPVAPRTARRYGIDVSF
jgi:hypothetical protein